MSWNLIKLQWSGFACSIPRQCFRACLKLWTVVNISQIGNTGTPLVRSPSTQGLKSIHLFSNSHCKMAFSKEVGLSSGWPFKRGSIVFQPYKDQEEMHCYFVKCLNIREVKMTSQCSEHKLNLQ